MGQAAKRGTFAERVKRAEDLITEQNAQQFAWTERYNHAIEQVVKETMEKWAKLNHPLLYIDYTLIEEILVPNDYSSIEKQLKA